MKRRTRLSRWLVSLAAAVGVGAGCEGPGALEVETTFAETFQRIVEDISEPNGVIGGQATVIVPGVVTWTGVYGRSGESSAMEPEMLTPLGSVAKTVISGLVLKLVGEGVISLKDTMGELLPAFANIPASVTVAQILRNSSGIPSYTAGAGFVDSLTADRYRVWTRAEIIRKFVGPPEFEPDASWKSSNTGYMLAEMIAERVTGRPLIDLYHEYLYDPLGLTGIAVLGAEAPSNPIAITWNGPAGGPFVNFTETYDGPSFRTGLGFTGSTVMNSETLARWAQGLFGDLLSPAMRAAMLTVIPDDGHIPGQTGAGLGVRRFGLLGRTQWGHSGSMFNGSAFILFDTASGIVVALVYNQPGASHNNSHFQLVEALLAAALGM